MCDLTCSSFDISMMTYWPPPPPPPPPLVNQIGFGVLEVSDDHMNQSWFLSAHCWWTQTHTSVYTVLLLLHLTSVWWHADPHHPSPPYWLIKLALVCWNYLTVIWINLGFCTLLMSTSVYTILLWIHLTSAWWHTDHPPPSVSGNQVGIGVLSHLLSYESVILVSACCWCTQVCDLTLGSFDISMMTYWPPYPSLLVNQVGIGVLELSDDLINQSWFLHNSGEHKCVHNLTLNSFDISMMACWPASPLSVG